MDTRWLTAAMWCGLINRVGREGNIFMNFGASRLWRGSVWPYYGHCTMRSVDRRKKFCMWETGSEIAGRFFAGSGHSFVIGALTLTAG